MGDDRLPFLGRHLSPTVGLDVRAAREAAGWSRREVAEAARLAARTLARIERGAQKPSRETLMAICEVMGLSFHTVAGPRWSDDAADTTNTPDATPGLAVRELLRMRGLTQRQVADAAGVSVATLSRFERGLTASRVLTSRAGHSSVAFLDRDVMMSNAALARILGLADVEQFASLCREASRMIRCDEPFAEAAGTLTESTSADD